MAYHVKAHSTTTTASNYYTRNSHEIEARKPMIATRSTPHIYIYIYIYIYSKPMLFTEQLFKGHTYEYFL